MTSLPDVNLIIIFIEKDRPSYTLHKISEDMKKLEDIYIAAIEDFIGVKIGSISTSPERDDTIFVEDPFNA